MKILSALKHSIFFYLVILVGVTIDYFSKKSIIELNSEHLLPKHYGNLLKIDLVYNKGISFGLFQNFEYSNLTFAIIASVFVLILLYWQHNTDSKLERFALALIISGALGNFIDRIYYHAVVDFIILHWQEYAFPVFNIADCAISSGITVILLLTLTSKTDNKVNK